MLYRTRSFRIPSLYYTLHPLAASINYFVDPNKINRDICGVVFREKIK